MVTLTFDIPQNQISVQVELDIVGYVKYHLLSIVYAWFYLIWARFGFLILICFQWLSEVKKVPFVYTLLLT